MKTLATISLALAFAGAALAQKNDEEQYPLTEDSKPHDGVPKGEMMKFTFSESSIFPGTTRIVTVYVPRQYDPKKPACVWVNQDGVQNNAPTVFDNLIAKGEMPVTIYIAASPGVVKALDGKVALDRFNRSLEYDGLGDAYARFVIDELLPFVERQKTGDGRPIVLSKRGSDRCIGGSSSGAVCAFTAAWERPDAFRRVFSSIGTYVGLRGADRYPTLIRKFEPKPLRIFLQDGDHDQNIYGGDWWMANQMMERALTFAGYEVNHAWGTGGHDGKQAAAIFPDAVRWLWKDWPKEPQAGAGSPQLKELLLPGEGWQLVWKPESSPELAPAESFASGAASNAMGEVFFNDFSKSMAYKVKLDGKVTRIPGATTCCEQAFGPDGRLYQISMARGGVTYSKNQANVDVADVMSADNLVVLNNGGIYVTGRWEEERGGFLNVVWLIPPKGEMRRVGTAPQAPTGIAVSPDKSLLYVSDARLHSVWSYQIQIDGSLKHRQEYCHLHEPDPRLHSGAYFMTVDRDGRLYVVTPLGIQVCDQAGRVNCIIPMVPTPNDWVDSITFGGADFDTLFVTCDGKVFKRKLKIRGAPAFLPPVKPAAPRL